MTLTLMARYELPTAKRFRILDFNANAATHIHSKPEKTKGKFEISAR